MVIYSYLIEHDLGLAPNPFGKYCTLAVCKPKIRKSGKLELGDWIIGTGSRALENSTGRKLIGKLIFAMKVTERITFEQYWYDERFQYKKPVIKGTLVTMFGDNFYHKDKLGNWVQEESAHSNSDGTCNTKHMETDIGGNNVLISDYFFYLGDKAARIPDHLKEVCHSGIGHKKLIGQITDEFVNWITNNFHTGIHGDPINWSKYDQLNFEGF